MGYNKDQKHNIKLKAKKLLVVAVHYLLFTIYSNPDKSIIQFVTYVIVGGFTTGLDLFLYWFVVEFLNVWYLLAAAVISPITLGLNYSLHRKLTFKSDGKKRVQLPRYFGLVIFNYLAGLSLLYVFVDLLGLNYMLGRVVVFGIIILWNFAALKSVVFR